MIEKMGSLHSCLCRWWIDYLTFTITSSCTQWELIQQCHTFEWISGAEYCSFYCKIIGNLVQNGKLCRAQPLVQNIKFKPILPKCDKEAPTCFSRLFRVPCWAIDLGRLDKYAEVSLLSQHLASPWLGDLEEVYHIFEFLKKSHNSFWSKLNLS